MTTLTDKTLAADLLEAWRLKLMSIATDMLRCTNGMVAAGLDREALNNVAGHVNTAATVLEGLERQAREAGGC
jgi:hypothetical protein